MAGIGSRVSFRRNRMGPVLIGGEQALQLAFFIACRYVLDRIGHFRAKSELCTGSTASRAGRLRCDANGAAAFLKASDTWIPHVQPGHSRRTIARQALR